MIYNITILSDLHWGILDPNTQYNNLESVFIFLKEFQNIDMIVIAGDYFDTKLSLNSNASILAVKWMHRLIEESKSYGVKKIRVVKGTEDHDNNQLEVFRSLEDDYFKIFNVNTVEETLPELKCIYCPDENINAAEYKDLYLDNILEFANIGFFHGSFDVVLPDIVVQLSEETSMKSIIYEYQYWSKFIKGPLIAGHWHDGNELDSLIYIGSYDRWAFNEMEDKGFGFIQIDTDTNEYFYKKILNRNALPYLTYNINTDEYDTLEKYNTLMNQVDTIYQMNQEMKIRIVVNITTDDMKNDPFIVALRQYYINNKNIKIVIKNKLKNEKKQIAKKKYTETKNKYSFIADNSVSKAEKIQRFILLTKGMDIPIDIVEKHIVNYIS